MPGAGDQRSFQHTLPQRAPGVRTFSGKCPDGSGNVAKRIGFVLVNDFDQRSGWQFADGGEFGEGHNLAEKQWYSASIKKGPLSVLIYGTAALQTTVF